MIIAQADARSRNQNTEQIKNLSERHQTLNIKNIPLTIKELAVNGKDIMNSLNIRSGEYIGTILKQLQDEVIKNPAYNTHEQLIQMALKIQSGKNL
jgi:tRNA nucleotidyltransferase (CCA-adding enzyme)